LPKVLIGFVDRAALKAKVRRLESERDDGVDVVPGPRLVDPPVRAVAAERPARWSGHAPRVATPEVMLEKISRMPEPMKSTTMMYVGKKPGILS